MPLGHWSVTEWGTKASRRVKCTWSLTLHSALPQTCCATLPFQPWMVSNVRIVLHVFSFAAFFFLISICLVNCVLFWGLLKMNDAHRSVINVPIFLCRSSGQDCAGVVLQHTHAHFLTLWWWFCSALFPYMAGPLLWKILRPPNPLFPVVHHWKGFLYGHFLWGICSEFQTRKAILSPSPSGSIKHQS